MRCSSNEFDWSAVAIVRLRLLWAEGHSTTEIGRRMGVSKNAIVGKAHRLNLPARPSPIRRDGVRKPPQPCRPRGPTLPALQSRPQKPSTPSQVGVVAAEVRRDQSDPVRSAPIVPEAVPVCAAIRGTKPCCWPIGEPGTRSFRYCDAPNEAGKPYCPHHCEKAYQEREPHRKAA